VQLILDGVLTRCDWTTGKIRSTLPFAIVILSLQANKAEVAATFALHVFAGIDVADEQTALGTGPGVRTSFNVSDRFGWARLQSPYVTLSSLSNEILKCDKLADSQYMLYLSLIITGRRYCKICGWAKSLTLLSYSFHFTFPFFPFLLPFSSLPLEVGPLSTTMVSGGAISVHFSLKI